MVDQSGAILKRCSITPCSSTDGRRVGSRGVSLARRRGRPLDFRSAYDGAICKSVGRFGCSAPGPVLMKSAAVSSLPLHRHSHSNLTPGFLHFGLSFFLFPLLAFSSFFAASFARGSNALDSCREKPTASLSDWVQLGKEKQRTGRT